MQSSDETLPVGIHTSPTGRRIGYSMLPEGVEGVDELAELALNLRNCWEHGADEIWKSLDPELWALTHNPWVVLQTVSRTRLEEVASDPGFKRRVADLIRRRERSAEAPWFEGSGYGNVLSCVAYFSMEFGLTEALPIYSGGLGNVAGDHLKTADDLGIPVVGVGLLYQQGYFRQFINGDGNQTELYPYNDPGQLPIMPVRDDQGEWFRIQIELANAKVWLRAWCANVGRIKLYLLDSNDPANPPVYRGITSELYGGGPELRLEQEIILGIGGWKMLHGIGLHPEVCHLNEGHAAFAVLERTRVFMAENEQKFAPALTATRAGNLFTTHTPVPAGMDRFAPELMERYLKHYAEASLGIGMPDLLGLGRKNPDDSREPFNMAYLAIHGACAVNGVSRLHASVSRELFQPLFQSWPRDEVPIGYVTNGVHTPTWDSACSDGIWTEACGGERWRGSMSGVGESIGCLSDSIIWEMRARNRQELVEYVRSRVAAQQDSAFPLVRSPEPIFDFNTLTIGFARRFAAYKRPNLLLHDPERLVRILTNPNYPVQLIVAGKAHPQDAAGKMLVRAWVQFVKRPEVRNHVVFLADYDLMLAEFLVHGVDVWVNTPRRPWEACGTSGMKILVNGGLNLSELDGWWAEAYSPEVGWALGDGQYHDDDPAWDAAEAEQLYSILENQLVPEFYHRDASGIPTGWVAKVRDSMASLTPRFSANRAAREYTEKYYVPAARAYSKRAANHGTLGEQILGWSEQLRRHWPRLFFGNVEVQSSAGGHEFRAQLYLDDVQPESVQVELYAQASVVRPAYRQKMERAEQLIGAAQGWIYKATAPADRPANDYTARVIPNHPDATIPLEAPQILWQR